MDKKYMSLSFYQENIAFQEALPMGFQIYVIWLLLGSPRNQVIWSRGICHLKQKHVMSIRKKKKMNIGWCQSQDWTLP